MNHTWFEAIIVREPRFIIWHLWEAPSVKYKKNKKTQSEGKWAKTLLLSGRTQGEPAHADAAGNPPGHVCARAKHPYSPEKSETTDKHPSKPEAAPSAIMFPALRVCKLIDSASSSPRSRTPRATAWQLVLSAAAGRCQPGQGPWSPRGTRPRPCPSLVAAVRVPLGPWAAAEPPACPQVIARCHRFSLTSEGRKGKGEGKGEGNGKALEIWNCS